MNPKAYLFAFLGPLTAHASLELVGEISASDGSQFVLADNRTGDTSGWIRIGDWFDGYKIEAYDSQSEILTLNNGTGVLRLNLRPTKVIEQKLRHGPTREEAIKMAANQFREAKIVIRALTVLKGNQWYYKCLEVWKSDPDGPTVGDIFLGPTLGIKETAPPVFDPTVTFGSDAVEELIFLGAFPVVTGTPSGGFPMQNGKLNLCPELPIDELRDILKASKG